jgi:hypothetical protein
MLLQALRQAKYTCLVTGKGTARSAQNHFHCQLLCITLKFLTVFNFLVMNVIFVSNCNFYIHFLKRFCNVSVLFIFWLFSAATCNPKNAFMKCIIMENNFSFYYFPVTFQFTIASQYHKCKRSGTNLSTFKIFLLCLAECLVLMFQSHALQTYISVNLQSYTYQPAIFKVILKLLSLPISPSVPAECCYLTTVTFLASVRR